MAAALRPACVLIFLLTFGACGHRTQPPSGPTAPSVTYLISGTVTDYATGLPIVGAALCTVQGIVTTGDSDTQGTCPGFPTSSNFGRTATTDSSGTYRLTLATSGGVILVASAAGYDRDVLRVSVTDTTPTATANFTLMPKSAR